MVGKLLNIRMNSDMYSEALELSKKEGYSSIQDFARSALREKMKALRCEIALFEISKLHGSAKNHIPRSKRELISLAERLYPKV